MSLGALLLATMVTFGALPAEAAAVGGGRPLARIVDVQQWEDALLVRSADRLAATIDGDSPGSGEFKLHFADAVVSKRIERRWPTGLFASVVVVGGRKHSSGVTLIVRARQHHAWLVRQTTDGIAVMNGDTEPSEATATMTSAAEDLVSTACKSTVDVESIEATEDGAFIHATGAITPIVKTVGDTNAPQDVVIEIPGAGAAGLRRQQLWPAGPLASVNVSVHDDAARCGLELRLRPRAAWSWMVSPTSSGAMLVAQELSPPLRAARRQLIDSLSAGLVAVADRDCAPTAEILAINETASGLLVRTSAPADGLISGRRRVFEQGFNSYSTVTIDLPRTSAGAAWNHVEWASGPFASMRLSRYLENGECGVRIRLQPRQAGDWRLEKTDDGVFITAEQLLAQVRQDEVRRKNERLESAAELAGSVRVEASTSLARAEGMTATAPYQVNAGMVQRLSNGTRLRGFVSSIFPSEANGSPYGAVGLSGLHVRNVVTDISAGDLIAGLGGVAGSDTPSLNSVMIRGAGISAVFPNRMGLQFFGGRTATPGLIRNLSGGSLNPIGDDRIVGVQGSKGYSDAAVAAGLLVSSYGNGRSQENLVEALILRKSLSSQLRVLFEQSRSSDESGGEDRGYALTLQPNVSLRRLAVSGVFRYLSRDFHPPAGSSFFSSLRHAYDISGVGRLWEGASITAAFGEAKSFSLFDPENVGTLSKSRALSFTYSPRGMWSAYLGYSQSDVKSDAGAVLPADSTTASASVGASFAWRKLMSMARVSTQHTTNFALDSLSQTRLEGSVDESYRFNNEVESYGRLQYSRSDSEVGGEGRGGSLGVRLTRQSASLSGEVGYYFVPAGVALSDSRRISVSLGGGVGTHSAQTTGQLSFQRLWVGNEPPRDVWLVTFHANRLLEWGTAPPMGVAESRAMPIVDTVATSELTAELEVSVVAAADGQLGDNRIVGVGGVIVSAGGRRIKTASDGTARTALRAGRQVVQLVLEGPVLEYYTPIMREEIDADPPRAERVQFVLRPAGHLVARIELDGASGGPSEGIRAIASSGSLSFSAVSDRSGELNFGLLPTGDYTITLDEATLPPDHVIAGAVQQQVTVNRGGRASTSFRLRKATARERFAPMRKPNP